MEKVKELEIKIKCLEETISDLRGKLEWHLSMSNQHKQSED